METAFCRVPALHKYLINIHKYLDVLKLQFITQFLFIFLLSVMTKLLKQNQVFLLPNHQQLFPSSKFYMTATVETQEICLLSWDLLNTNVSIAAISAQVMLEVSKLFLCSRQKISYELFSI